MRRQGSTAASRKGKYGWSNKMISVFLNSTTDNGEPKPYVWINPRTDMFGRDKDTIYSSLWMAITRNFAEEPVAVWRRPDCESILLLRTDAEPEVDFWKAYRDYYGW